MIQLTYIQIDNFGPFTEEMGHNREHRIQILLSKIFIFLQKQFNRHGGLVFSAARDNMIAVSNGISIKNHQIIIDKLEKKFPITISIGIGKGKTPLEAQIEASKVLINKGSAQSSRKKVLAYNGHKLPIINDVKVAHIDINYYTKLATDVNPFYKNYIDLNRAYLTLMEGFLTIGALCFFNGGDNFICVCPPSMDPNEIRPIMTLFESKHEPWKLKAGIGVGKNILEAISKANICLKEIRDQHNKKQIIILTS
ncbi:MAG: GTP cyclohydrolase IIa [Promethearchaeota archaeon]|nr:MAG: GTP cyclohydrolase IIa [Candidatus Lokiarchaeota archaeon]